jgi:tetratricopeptide (TPR) repeat protein
LLAGFFLLGMLDRVFPRGLAFVLGLIATMAVAQARQSAAPALPELAMDRFPAEARTSIQAAYREAVGRAEDGAAAGRLGMVLQAWEQWDSALAVYRRAQGLAPQTFDWWYLAGVIEARLGRASEATRSFERASALRADYVPARLKLAEALFDSGDLVGSRRIYEALAGAGTGAGVDAASVAGPAAHYGLGRILAAQGDQAGAIAQFQEACRLFPEFGAAHYALALAYRGVGRMEDAQREMALQQRYLNAWPGVDDPVAAQIAPLRDDARAHMERGITAWKAGNLDLAIQEHEEAVRLQPSLAQAHANLIILYGQQQNAAAAEAHYRTVVSLNSNLGDAHYNYGVLLMDTRRYEDAVDAFNKALAVTPTFRAARFNLGRTLIALGRLDEAIAAFEQVQSPEDADTPRYRYALAAAHLRAGHREQGTKLALEAKALAQQYGQSSLVASIDRDLASIAAR